MTLPILPYGYQRGLPEGTKCAWGARFIWPDELVPDRQGAFGPPVMRESLIDYLNDVVGAAPRLEAARLALLGLINQSDEREVVLYEDEVVIVKANPQASHGYLYVVGYRKADVPGAEQPLCSVCGEPIDTTLSIFVRKPNAAGVHALAHAQCEGGLKDVPA